MITSNLYIILSDLSYFLLPLNISLLLFNFCLFNVVATLRLQRAWWLSYYFFLSSFLFAVVIFLFVCKQENWTKKKTVVLTVENHISSAYMMTRMKKRLLFCSTPCYHFFFLLCLFSHFGFQCHFSVSYKKKCVEQSSWTLTCTITQPLTWSCFRLFCESHLNT